MLILIFLICLIETSLSQKKDQQYNQVIGLQNFEIQNISSKNISEKQKISFTLIHQDGEIPILIICNNYPQNNTLTNYDQILNENCLSDINAYDQNQEIQSISLTKNVKSETFQKYFNIYQMENESIFVGAYSKLKSTYKISFEIQSLYNCGKECKNGGVCLYGVCECQEGTFGDDCNIIGINIENQRKLSPNKLYYLNLYQIGTTFQRILSNQIPLRQQCYTEKPFIDQGSLLITNLIQLNYDQIQNCRNLTKFLQDEIQIKQNAYFIFKIQFQLDVNILIDDNSDNGLEQLMMIIFIPFSVVIFFFIVCAFVQCYKKKLEQTQVVKNKFDQNLQENFINLYMPDYKFQQIKDIIQEDINEQESYCSICLEKFNHQNDVKVTYCKHIYHSLCLQMWIKKIKICPLCRAPLDEKTLTSMVPLRSQTLIDQISSKSSDNNKIKILSLNSLSSLNGPNNQNAFQHLNYQRSLVLVE